MKEKGIQSIFGRINTIPGVFELKICKARSIRFDAVRPHQIEALKAAISSTGLYHKINDLPVYAGSKTKFASQKPFDCFLLKDTPAYIVICFYKARKYKRFYYVIPYAWEREHEKATKKSINEDQVDDICSYCVEILNGKAPARTK